jgi:hypothetical protein
MLTGHVALATTRFLPSCLPTGTVITRSVSAWGTGLIDGFDAAVIRVFARYMCTRASLQLVMTRDLAKLRSKLAFDEGVRIPFVVHFNVVHCPELGPGRRFGPLIIPPTLILICCDFQSPVVPPLASQPKRVVNNCFHFEVILPHGSLGLNNPSQRCGVP